VVWWCVCVGCVGESERCGVWVVVWSGWSGVVWWGVVGCVGESERCVCEGVWWGVVWWVCV
jgi:hypothetical protein